MKKLLQEEISKAKARAQKATEKSTAAKAEFEKAKKELFAKEVKIERKAMEVRFKRKVRCICSNFINSTIKIYLVFKVLIV